MKIKFLNDYLILIILSIATVSCANLRSINNFSSTSLSGLAKFDEIRYSFTQHCIDRCVFENVRIFEIKRTVDCDCDIYKKADSVTLLIYHSISGYFDGLTALSGNGLTSYNVDTLGTLLTTGTFGEININQEQVTAYSVISNVLLNAIAGRYRKSKIKKYVEEANQPLQILLAKFQFILRKNLEGELEFKKERLYDISRELMLSSSLNEYEKEKAVSEYYENLDEINRKKQKIEVFANSLMDVASGHQKIFDNINKMTTKEVKNSLAKSQKALRNSISQFNKLNQ